MSRAFVKESDGDQVPDDLPERAHSDLPNYITRPGLARMKDEVRRLQTVVDDLADDDHVEAKSRKAAEERELRYLTERLRRAIPVDLPLQPQKVQFGVTVTLLDEAGEEHVFTLVGEDEADLKAGRLNWASRLGTILMGCEVGDEALWLRGEAQLQVDIIDITVHS